MVDQKRGVLILSNLYSSKLLHHQYSQGIFGIHHCSGSTAVFEDIANPSSPAANPESAGQLVRATINGSERRRQREGTEEQVAE